MSDDENEGKYLSLSDELEEMRYGSGFDKSVAGLKIVGKSLFNIGKFAVTEVLPQTGEYLEKEAEKRRK